MLRSFFAGLLIVLATGAHAQVPFETDRGRLCLEGWITTATGLLNTHDGDQSYNSQKPWRVNRFGLFLNKNAYSNYEPDNWVQFGANRDTYMWNAYPYEEAYPNWPSQVFVDIRVPGLRHYVRNCIAGDAATQPVSPPATPGLPAGTPMPAVVPQTATCPNTLDLLTNYPGVVLGCYCPALGDPGTVWGLNPYTVDSHLCTAAVHSGTIPAAGGVVWATVGPGQTSYNGSTRFGITTRSYGSYGASSLFLNAPTDLAIPVQQPNCPGNMKNQKQALTCYCDPSNLGAGTVWGTDTYTDDSALCRAAVHAGVLPRTGGTVTAYPFEYGGPYQGSERNGVTTKDYGQWQGAFSFR